MIIYALKMLLGDRAKYFGLLFGITFTSFLVTFAAAYLGGMMTRSFALVAETPADIWVMDPAVASVDQTINLPDSALDRVRNVDGVRSAVPLALATAEVRFPNGRFQSVQMIGVDDATLAGVPHLPLGLAPTVLRTPDAVIVDDGGSTGKLQTPSRRLDQWPHDGPHLHGPSRHLARGDDVLVNDHRALVVAQSRALPRYPPRPLFFTTYQTMERMLPAERRRLTFVLATARSGVNPPLLARRIAAATGLRARTATDFEDDTVRWMLVNSEDVGDVITMLTIALLVGFGVTGVMMFMFTHENLKHYAVLHAMGATGPRIVALVFAQSATCALLGTGLGLGLCTLAGRVFTAVDFPFRLMWFAPLLGGVAVVLVSLGAAAVSLRPVLKMEPALLLTGRQP